MINCLVYIIIKSMHCPTPPGSQACCCSGTGGWAVEHHGARLSARWVSLHQAGQEAHSGTGRCKQIQPLPLLFFFISSFLHTRLSSLDPSFLPSTSPLSLAVVCLVCSQELSAAVISQWKKESLRSKLKALKDALHESDKAVKAQLIQKVRGQ